MNSSICSKCKKVVPAEHRVDSNKEYLDKKCPDCGVTSELLSNDSAAYRKKRDFMSDRNYPGCGMNCLECEHKQPNIIFIETTNRCNMNCPICITNVPSMGFEFEPRMDFFKRIFEHYSKYEFPPSVQLFGGEPTMRDDIFEVIRLARSYGLSVRLVTNGLKLSDKAYCDKMMASGASVLISFDGLRREMYEKLRAFPGSLDLKYKALENISQHKKGKVVLMTVIDKNFNGADMPQFLEYCQKNSGLLRGMFLMPLTHVWSEERLEYKPERTTQEDVEKIVRDATDGKAEFVPLGSLEFKNLAKVFKVKHMPFLGVHPNCESFTLLVSNGKKYLSISSYLRYGFWGLVKDIRELDKKVGNYTDKAVSAFRKILIGIGLAGIFLKNVDFNAVFGAKGLKCFGKIMRFIFLFATGKPPKKILKEDTEIKSILQILLLPFEDDCTVESERLEKCASCFAYIDVKTDTVKSIPFCIWEKFKKVIMKDIAEVYNKEGYFKGLSQNNGKTEEHV
ncbi:MAG TPA: radical SAM protein [Candidatus Omnitrophota bacterium]|nr:radical SAM protein [Candidatus Omnitrophota bacterium]HPS20771.1 radical SAM protein [Candidatus Omnitrophota bacterium]